jgi:hypothetical protein
MNRVFRGVLAAIGAVLATVMAAGRTFAVPAPDAAQLASLRAACEAASAVRVVTRRGNFMSDRPTLEEAGVRLSTPGGRPALITNRTEPIPGRLLEWTDIEQVDAGRRMVARRTLIGFGAGAFGAALLLKDGPDASESGDNVMLLLAGLTLGVGTTAGYLYGTGYPVWNRVYP